MCLEKITSEVGKNYLPVNNLSYQAVVLLLKMMAGEGDLEQELRVKETKSIPEQQKDLRQKIIRSIVKQGILSGKDLMARGIIPQSSADSLDSAWLLQTYGSMVLRKDQRGVEWSHPKRYTYPRVEVDIGNSRKVIVAYDEEEGNIEDQFINWALYLDISSVLPVIAERDNEKIRETSQLPAEILRDRLANSILVLVPSDKIEINVLNKYEVGAKSSIPSNKFLAVITPEHLAAEVKQLFSETKIPVLAVSNRKSKLFEKEIELTVPDYESEVRRWLSSSPVPLFLHGVRLPTESDVEPDQSKA